MFGASLVSTPPGKPAAVKALSCDDPKHQALSDVLGGRGSSPVETIKLTRPLTACGPALGSSKKGRCSGPWTQILEGGAPLKAC